MAILKLPHWCITDTHPAFYDTESATAIEMVAKLYGAINEIIEDYNKFVDNINKTIEDFESGITKDFNTFKIEMSQQFQDFIDTVELKLGEQDNKIKQDFEAIKRELNVTINNIINNIDDKFREQDSKIDEAIREQDSKIDEAIANMVNNVYETTYNIINQNIIEGKLAMGLTYNAEEEELLFALSDNVYANNTGVAVYSEYFKADTYEGFTNYHIAMHTDSSLSYKPEYAFWTQMYYTYSILNGIRVAGYYDDVEKRVGLVTETIGESTETTYIKTINETRITLHKENGIEEYGNFDSLANNDVYLGNYDFSILASDVYMFDTKEHAKNFLATGSFDGLIRTPQTIETEG